VKTAIFASTLMIGLAGSAQAQFSSPNGLPTKAQPQVKQVTAPGAVNVQQPGGTVFGGGDDCASATPIVGQGTFGYDNTGATTGTDGQTESLCFFFGSSAVDNDVWFEWTADADGVATVSTCNGTTDDSKLAAYPSGTCGSVGSAIACNDDSCGLQSTIQFSVTNGSSYLIQVGNFPGVIPSVPGSFDILIAGVSGNDNCANPDMLMGQGSFAYDNTSASTGGEGQTESLCFAFGSSAIDNDIWYTWTADADGIAIIDTCGSVLDTKLAAYPGSASCPAPGTSLACNDDACGLQSTISFDVTAGTAYTLQVGNFPGTGGGPGTLNITIGDAPDCYTADDGVTENSIGLTAGGEVAWLQAFDAIGGSDVITEISTAYGSAAFGGLSPGLPGRLLIYDGSDDADPSNYTLIWDSATTGSNEDTDFLNATPVPNIAVSGRFFIGASLDNVPGEFPAPLDQTFAGGGNAWIVGSTLGAGSLDINNLGLNDVPPLDVDGLFPGNWLLRAVGNNCGSGGLGTNYCSASANSVSPDGSTISAAGSASITDGDLTLSASNAPSQPAIFYFGPNQVDIPFGCGRRCVGGSVVRMDVVFGSGGTFEYAVTPTFFGVFTATSTNFQCWYRDPANLNSCGGTFNLSDGIEIVFTP
jgi:hypothetical protein